jgi:hypothetical protein
MDETGGLRVADLLPDRLEGIEERVKEQACRDPAAGKMKLAWDLIGSEVEGALRSALDCDLIELLAQGWARARALQDYADPEKHPPGETAIVHLGERDFARELHPVVAVSIAGCPELELRFTLELAAHFSGLALSVRAGHIIGGRTGDAHVSAQLKYGEADLHKAKESKKLQLPGRFSFAPPGLRIPPKGKDSRG